MISVPLKMPRYTTARQRYGKWEFYFQIPVRQRPEGWPPGVMRLRDDRGQPITDPALAVARGRKLNEQLDRARAQMKTPPVTGTMTWLIREYQHSENYKKKAEKTRYEYARLAGRLLDWSRERGEPPIALIGTPQVLKFLAAFEDRPAYRDRLASLGSLLWNFAKRRGAVTHNVWQNLGLERSQPDVHVWTETEIATVIAQADAMGRPSIGTAVLLASDSGQRQADVLDMRRGREWDGTTLRRVQNKTGAYVAVPATERLKARLALLPEDRAALVINDTTGRSWHGPAFTKAFRDVANAAGLPHLEFRSLRATCVCRLADAGATTAEIASVTGHTLVSVNHILKHYWRPTDTQARHAIAKMERLRRSVEEDAS